MGHQHPEHRDIFIVERGHLIIFCSLEGHQVGTFEVFKKKQKNKQAPPEPTPTAVVGCWLQSLRCVQVEAFGRDTGNMRPLSPLFFSVLALRFEVQ